MDETFQQLNNLLKVDKNDLTPRISGKKREDRIAEAISWNSGVVGNLEYHTIFSEGEYSIRLGKPGKEAAQDYNMCKYKDGHRGNNPNDMRPVIFKNNILQENQVASFTEIFNELQTLGRADEYSLELIACLLFRSAYMIDHIETLSGIWRYDIPVEILNKIEEKLPIADNIPIKVFLHFLDALAWNEDTKYHTLGFNIKDGTGRKNNLLTCVNLIGVLLNKVPISKFAGSFSRPPIGISAISNKEALQIFPLLKPQD
jgi:hypothetical protein